MNRIQMFILLFLCTSSYLLAQQGTVAAGGNASGIGGSVSYSVGQVVYTVASGTAGTSSQGLQKAYEITVGLNKLEGIQLFMSVYPNPTTSTLNLEVEERYVDQLSFELYNAVGQLILKREITNSLTAVPMEELVSGTYFLKLQTDKELVKTFSIIKNR